MSRKNNAVAQEAVDLLNMVHTRAGITAYKLADFSNPQAFLDELFATKEEKSSGLKVFVVPDPDMANISNLQKPKVLPQQLLIWS